MFKKKIIYYKDTPFSKCTQLLINKASKLKSSSDANASVQKLKRGLKHHDFVCEQ